MSEPDSLVEALLDPAAYPHPVAQIEVVETHISWVFLTGQYAYKVKKPVRLDFVDFSTLTRRHEACLDEVRLNRRFAPQIYLEVLPIAEQATDIREADRSQGNMRSRGRQLHVGGAGAAVEYAVKMREFPAKARLDRVLARNEFSTGDCDRLAATIAERHRNASVAARDTPFGEPATIMLHVRDVLKSAGEQTRSGPYAAIVERIGAWVESELARLTTTFERRKSGGWIRECHGDLHSENIAMLDGQAVPFDCLEFRDDLRWIDCASDIAFLTMDLADRRHPRLAHRLLNAYTEQTGDLEALAVLRYYQTYRALVRAMVTTMQQRTLQEGDVPHRAASYLQLAEEFTRESQGALVITHGVSGTGKTTATQELLEQAAAVRLRSDIERRRDEAAGVSRAEEERYTAARRAAVYDMLLRKAEIGLRASYRMIVDATFLLRANRDAFRQLAMRMNAPFLILEFGGDPATLRHRIASRQSAGGDASEATLAVLDQQLAEREPLAEDERKHAVKILHGAISPALDRLIRPADQ